MRDLPIGRQLSNNINKTDMCQECLTKMRKCVEEFLHIRKSFWNNLKMQVLIIKQHNYKLAFCFTFCYFYFKLS